MQAYRMRVDYRVQAGLRTTMLEVKAADLNEAHTIASNMVRKRRGVLRIDSTWMMGQPTSG